MIANSVANINYLTANAGPAGSLLILLALAIIPVYAAIRVLDHLVEYMDFRGEGWFLLLSGYAVVAFVMIAENYLIGFALEIIK
jgi:hypothetical protein